MNTLSFMLWILSDDWPQITIAGQRVACSDTISKSSQSANMSCLPGCAACQRLINSLAVASKEAN